MQRCPFCGSYYRTEEICVRDGTPLEPASGIVDRYQVVDRVGVGGMGSVYKAIHTLLDNRVVAIKLLHRQLSQNPEVVNRFFREARAASKVENEHIIEVIDFGVTPEGDSFLVMEHLEGESLRDVLDREGALRMRRVFSIGVQIAEGLYAAHRKGIVHRDLKPENVMLVRRKGTDFVKLLDFGIAKLTEHQDSRLTHTGMVVGTPAYMSPEQAGGETVDHRTDIYALGTILYEMLTGRTPFVADTTKQVLLLQLTRPPAPPREYRPDIPESVEAVILHALHKDRRERPQTMLHLAYELRDALRRPSADDSLPPPAMVRAGAGTPGVGGVEPGVGATPGLVDAGQHGAAPAAASAVPGRPASSPDSIVETTFSVRGTALRRALPVVGLGLGLLLGVGITVMLMRPEAPAGNAAASAVRVGDGGAARRPATPGGVRPTTGGPDSGVEWKVVKLKGAHTGPGKLRVKRAGGEAHNGARVSAPREPRVSAPREPRVSAPPTPRPGPPSAFAATVASVPPGATVYDGEAKLGQTPLKVDTGQARALTVHILGYEPKKVRLAAESTTAVTVKLKRSTMSWEVMSAAQLKKMMEQGQISRFTYERRKAELDRAQDEKIVEVRVKYKTGEITKEQYERAVKAIRDSYR